MDKELTAQIRNIVDDIREMPRLSNMETYNSKVKQIFDFAEHYHEMKSKFKDLEIKKYKRQSEMWQSDYDKAKAIIKELEGAIYHFLIDKDKYGLESQLLKLEQALRSDQSDTITSSSSIQ